MLTVSAVTIVPVQIKQNVSILYESLPENTANPQVLNLHAEEEIERALIRQLVH